MKRLAFAFLLASAMPLYAETMDTAHSVNAAIDAGLSALAAHPAVPSPLEKIRKSLQPFEVLKGNFQQTKAIKILKMPLKSSGSFTLAKGKGLIWKPAKPIVSTLLITRDDIASIQDGHKQIFVSMKEQPALRVIGKILFAVFAADLDELQKHFTFSDVQCTRGVWDLTLKPNDAGVAKAVSTIYIHGAKTVQSLKLVEANSDLTNIEFLDVTEKTPLTKDEEALFE